MSADRLLSIPEVAARLDCSRTHVYDLIAAGCFPTVDISAAPTGSKARVAEDDVTAFIDARTSKPARRKGAA